MIVLPERDAARGRILLPQRRREWISSSQRSGLHQIENTIRWRIDARLHDGHCVWRGWFDDREDADAFLRAALFGSLRYERDLWRLPMPQWHPDLGEDLTYYIFTNVALTTTSASNQTWNVPSDFNNSGATYQAVGGGGTGAAAGSTNACAGGGAGAYAKTTDNLSLTASGTATFQIKAAAAGITTSGTGTNGNDGGDVWLSNTGSAPTLTSQGVLAKGGLHGQFAAANPTGGQGGQSASCVGNTTASGGNAASAGASGGGGAGGPNGTGGSSSGGNSAGGSADNGTTSGTAGVANGTGPTGNASAGTEFDGSHGCGAGSGGCNNGGGGATSGSGGTYGGASGGAQGTSSSSCTTGAAGQGLLFIVYTPASSGFIFDLSNPMR